MAAECSICGTRISNIAGRYGKHRHWIGYIRYGHCEACERDVVVFYGEDKSFLFTQIGAHFHLNSMFQFSRKDDFARRR